MGLKNLKFAGTDVETSGGKLAVRGLSLAHIELLVNRHRAEIEEIFDKAVASEKDPVQNGAAFGMSLLSVAPHIVAELIVVASGESLEDKDAVEIATSLSIQDQRVILEKVGDLTFMIEGGGLKKLVGAVIGEIQGARVHLPSA